MVEVLERVFFDDPMRLKESLEFKASQAQQFAQFDLIDAACTQLFKSECLQRLA